MNAFREGATCGEHLRINDDSPLACLGGALGIVTAL
jgi:hypothetical protein